MTETKTQLTAQSNVASGALFGEMLILSGVGQKIYVNGQLVNSIDSISQVPIVEGKNAVTGNSVPIYSSLAIQTSGWIYKLRYNHISVTQNTSA